VCVCVCVRALGVLCYVCECAGVNGCVVPTVQLPLSYQCQVHEQGGTSPPHADGEVCQYLEDKDQKR